MALRFKVETLKDKVRFHVKGVEVELSYHAASALCNTIFSMCDERAEFKSNKFDYWRKQGRNGHKVNVRPRNREQYNKFLKSGQSKLQKEQKRKAAMQAKIKELQERHHITPRAKESKPKHPLTPKERYWLDMAKVGRFVPVKECNVEEYREFLRLYDIDIDGLKRTRKPRKHNGKQNDNQ